MIPAEQYKSIMEVLQTMNQPMDEEKKKSSFVAGMKDWLTDLGLILDKAANLAPSQRKMFVIHYARWVKSYGSYYRTILKNNPGLAAVFSTIEDSFKIEVRLLGEDEIKVFDKDSSLNEAVDSDIDFIETMVELIHKNPSTATKAKFIYQFKRWSKTNPREMRMAESQCPTLFSLVNAITDELEPHDTVNASDVEHLRNQEKVNALQDQPEVPPIQ